MKRLLPGVQWLVLSLLFAVIALFATYIVLRPNPTRADSEQYKVLSAYIARGLTGESHDLGSRRGLVLIANRTTFSQPMVNSTKLKQYVALVLSSQRRRASMPELSRRLIFEFWAANLRDETLERRFQFAAPYALATEEEMKLWPSAEFMARFPDSYGVLTFSRVAFNSDLTEAMFYTEHLCGLCGEGKFVLMRKTAGKWIEVDSASMWIS